LILCSKFTKKNRLSAGLRPDPLGSLHCFPGRIAGSWGREGKGEKEQQEEESRERRGRERRVPEGYTPNENGYGPDRRRLIARHACTFSVVTSSSAVAKRPPDASCLSVVSFVASIVQYLKRSFFIISYFSFGFTSAYNSILFCCLWRNVKLCCHTYDLS